MLLWGLLYYQIAISSIEEMHASVDARNKVFFNLKPIDHYISSREVVIEIAPCI